MKVKHKIEEEDREGGDKQINGMEKTKKKSRGSVVALVEIERKGHVLFA